LTGYPLNSRPFDGFGGDFQARQEVDSCLKFKAQPLLLSAFSPAAAAQLGFFEDEDYANLDVCQISVTCALKAAGED
jgi:hypothetical protein